MTELLENAGYAWMYLIGVAITSIFSMEVALTIAAVWTFLGVLNVSRHEPEVVSRE